MTPTEDLSPLPDLSFTDVESCVKETSGFQNTAKTHTVSFSLNQVYMHKIYGKDCK